MQLSRLLLNPRSNDVRRDIANVHNMHRRVLSAFPDQRLEAPRRHFQVLYRLEIAPDGIPSLLVQSEPTPLWEGLPHDYLLPSYDANPAVRPLGPLLDVVEPGATFRFRLRANPTKRLRTGTTVPGKRVELNGQDALMSWLERKAAAAGFEPARKPASTAESISWASSVTIFEESKVRGGRAGASITLGSALFEGQLRVTAPDAFKTALKGGIGTAKSYGFGLLSIAPS